MYGPSSTGGRPLRQGASDLSVFPDQNDINKRMAETRSTTSMPLYPGSSHETSYAIETGFPLMKDRRKRRVDGKLYVTSNLAGLGAEEVAKFPNNPKFARIALEEGFDFAGIANETWDPRETPPEQGITAAIGGLHAVPKITGINYEPGDILRVEACDPQKTSNGSNGFSRKFANVSEYPWVVVPDSPLHAGERIMSHFSEMLTNDENWNTVMESTGSRNRKGWLASLKADTDSSIMAGIMLVRKLLHEGILVINDGSVAIPNAGLKNDTLNPGMSADQAAIFLAERLGLQVPSNNVPRSSQMAWNIAKREFLMATYFDGTYRNYEIGGNDPKIKTRETHSSQINTNSPGGIFLNKQLNHVRDRYAGTIQLIDIWNSKRIGKVVRADPGSHYVQVALAPGKLA